MTWERVRDGLWHREDGASIQKVNPRGLVLYALRMPGARRPQWFHELEGAKRAS